MIDKEKTGMMIQDYMRMKDLTAKDIQEALGLTSVQAVYHWINGRCLPSLDNIYALSDLLKVPIDKLFVGNNDYVVQECECNMNSRIYTYYRLMTKVNV